MGESAVKARGRKGKVGKKKMILSLNGQTGGKAKKHQGNFFQTPKDRNKTLKEKWREE